MEQIAELFFTLMIGIVYLVGIVSTSLGSEQRNNAEDMKAAVIAEIENSNFNEGVISQCQAAAADKGYTLTIENCVYDDYHDIQVANVLLDYKVDIPILGVTLNKQVHGIAR